MTTAFTRTPIANIGATLTPLYVAPANTKAVLVGCILTNKTPGALPLTVIIRPVANAGGGDINLLRNGKVAGGQSVDPAQGRKCILLPGDQIMAQSVLANAFDASVSVLEGVS
ncbi:hypothetical protein ACO0K3_04810 [Undibacterium sp. Rencai35W]|uniref:hypothetical protein n=1 Tax=Undibacterium sp. Rencai35W TaxID=3413046 RepID=UPI003BF0BD02